MSSISKIKLPDSDITHTLRASSAILLSNLSTIDNITVATDSTKGVSPYNTSYGYTNITVDTSKVSLIESDLTNGTLIGIQLSAAVGSSYRNVRIRFGSDGTWIPIFSTTSILAGNSYLGASAYRQFIYSDGVYASGAFHMMNDSNTTYSNPVSFGIGYGTCSTAAATAAKVVTLSSYTLQTNGIVAVKFDNAVPASATMNINSKGEKAIYYKNAAITANVIKAGDIATFIYNGTNYILTSIDRIASEIGDLSGLSTTTKTDIVSAVNETFTSVSNGKASVASAITDKGVTTASDATFSTMATNIRAIPTGGVTPTGNIELQQQSGTNVTNYATASVKSGSATTPATTKQQSKPTFSQSGNTITANVAATSVDVTPTISAGWVSSGTAGTITMSANSNTYTIPSGSATTPATTKQQSKPTFSLSGNVLTATVAATSVSVTPTVSAGYISSGTAGTITMGANSSTYTINSNVYRTGSGSPSSSLGNDGDLYVDIS